MKPNVYDPNCPTRAVLDRMGDKWTVLVVLTLLDGPQRFSRLRDLIGGVAPKVLTQTLRTLERDEYELTPLGRSLEEPIRAISGWAEQNMARITKARSAYDRSSDPPQRAAAHAGRERRHRAPSRA
jgi:DNA-binding HxlR family transcriptional regulator